MKKIKSNDFHQTDQYFAACVECGHQIESDVKPGQGDIIICESCMEVHKVDNFTKREDGNHCE